MPLEDFVQSSIYSTAQLIEKKSFSDVLIFGQHDAFSARVRAYEGAGSSILKAMKADGLGESTQQYRAVAGALGMDNAARKFLIGLRSPGTKQRTRVTIDAIADSTEYHLDYSAVNGFVTRLTVTSGTGATITSQRDLEVSAINASDMPITATADGSDSYFIDADFYVGHTLTGDDDKTITNITSFVQSTESVSDALDACETLVDFVGVTGLSPDKATAMAVTDWGAAREQKLTAVLTSDIATVDALDESDILSLLKVGAAGFVFVDKRFWNMKHVGLFTDRLSTNIDVGILPRFNDVYLKGYLTSDFTATERGVLESKGAFLTSRIGVKAVTNPHVKSMSGERPHVELGSIWFNQRIKEQLAELLIDHATNFGGLDMGEDGLYEMRVEIKNIHAVAIRMKLCSDTPITLIGLTVDEVTQAEKDAERLAFEWEAELQNSILSAVVKGSLVTQIEG